MPDNRVNRLVKLLGIKYPIIQAGMVWVSGGRLASASAEAGILGVIGAGSMQPDVLRAQLQKAKSLTSKTFAVNVPLLYEKTKEQLDIALAEGVKIFITSAGSPKLYTSYLKDHGATVLHVVSSPRLAEKVEASGCDAVIAEGFEAGGHNGRDEITTMALIPQVVDSVSIPVIAAGGIADGRGIAAALALGASGVQIGTRFACTEESSAHINFKQAIIKSAPEDTVLCMKKLVPVRLIKNSFAKEILSLEEKGADRDELSFCLGKSRAKNGILLGDLEQGELEVGQISGLIKDMPKTEDLVKRLLKEYNQATKLPILSE